MPGLLNETPPFMPFSSVGPRTQRVLSRAQNKAYEPYQEAEARGADWINYNPFIIMDSMYRAGQEGIGETIRQVGDAFGYPDQGKEVARGINSGLEYLATRAGSDFSTPGFGIPIEANPARYVDAPAAKGNTILYHATRGRHDSFDHYAPVRNGNESGGLYVSSAPEVGYGEPATPLDPSGRLWTIEANRTKDNWMDQFAPINRQSKLIQDALAPHVESYMEKFLKENSNYRPTHFNYNDPIEQRQNLRPYDVLNDGLDLDRKKTQDLSRKGVLGTTDEELGDVLFDPQNNPNVRVIGKRDIPYMGGYGARDNHPAMQEFTGPQYAGTFKFKEPRQRGFSRVSPNWGYIPYKGDFSDRGLSGYRHLLGAGALSTQDAPLSFPRRR